MTAENLLESEEFWPYHVELERSWTPPGGTRPIKAGSPNVLIRVLEGGLARVHFNRDGIHTVPVAKTDLVEQANAIRLGRDEKIAPNFVVAIGTKVLDPADARIRPGPLGMERVAEHAGFLCVFADPGAEGFEALVKSLAPMKDRHGVMTLFFPQGEHANRDVSERLRGLGWAVGYLPDHLSEAYTAAQIGSDAPVPTVLLQTAEGRLIFQTSDSVRDIPAKLTVALDASFPSTAAASAGDDSEPRS